MTHITKLPRGYLFLRGKINGVIRLLPQNIWSGVADELLAENDH